MGEPSLLLPARKPRCAEGYFVCDGGRNRFPIVTADTISINKFRSQFRMCRPICDAPGTDGFRFAFAIYRTVVDESSSLSADLTYCVRGDNATGIQWVRVIFELR